MVVEHHEWWYGILYHIRDNKLSHRWLKRWKQSTCRKFCILNGCLISKKKKKLFNEIYGFLPVINAIRLCKWYLHLQRCSSKSERTSANACVCLYVTMRYLVMRIVYMWWSLLDIVDTKNYTEKHHRHSCVKIVHSNSCLYVSYLSSVLNFQITHLFIRFKNLHLHNLCQLNVLTGWQSVLCNIHI